MDDQDGRINEISEEEIIVVWCEGRLKNSAERWIDEMCGSGK